MDIYEKNLAFLKRVSPELAAGIEQAVANDAYEYVAETAKNGEPTLILRHGGESIQIHSKYNPGEEGRRLVAAEDLDNKEVVIVIGLGLGYQLNEILRIKKSYTSVLVVEKDPQLFRIYMQHADCEAICMQNVRYIVGKGAEDAAQDVCSYWWQISTQKYAVIQYRSLTNNVVDEIKQYYGELFDSVKRHLNYHMLNQNTIISNAKEMQQHVWENIVEVITHHGVNTLFGTFRNIPAIVVAAGPSLDKQLPLLKKAKGRAVIICVDTALKTLLGHGITPDIAVAVDYSQLNYEKVKDVETDGYVMAVLPAVVSGFFRLFGENMLIYYNASQFYQWFGSHVGEKGLLPPGGSVTHSAFQIAKGMGCDPIIFNGLDLAYTGGATHSSGGMYDGETVDELGRENLMPIEAGDGSTVYTSRAMWGMILAMEKMVENCEARVIDATEGGAHITGTDLRTFVDTFDEFLGTEYEIPALLDQCIKQPVAFDKAAIVASIAKMTDEMQNVVDLAAEGGINAKRIIKQMKKKGFDPIKVTRYLKDVRDIHTRITEKEDFSELINNILMGLAREHALNKVLYEEGAAVDRKDIAADMKELDAFFDGINESCSWYLDLFRQALKKIEKELA